VLKANGIEISMSRRGNPWDNAACESFMKTLKYEEVLRNEYRDLALPPNSGANQVFFDARSAFPVGRRFSWTQRPFGGVH